MYFKRIKITALSTEKIENNVRLLSLRRHTHLDFKSASTYIAEPNKFFLGYENDRKIDLLRIITPFERLLPKIIVTFDKTNFQEYKLRLKLISLIILILLTIGLVFNLVFSIQNGRLESDLRSIVIVNLIFYLLLFVEYKLVKRKMDLTLNWKE